MGNKRNKKHPRAAGTDKKTMSKGNGHFNPNQILIADWLTLYTGGFWVLLLNFKVFQPSERESDNSKNGMT